MQGNSICAAIHWNARDDRDGAKRNRGSLLHSQIIVLQRITSLDNQIRLITPQDICLGVFLCVDIITKTVEFYNFVDYDNMK